MNIEPQYLKSVTKGSTVTYGKKPYRVQDDGKGKDGKPGYLHIIVFENGQRKKVAIEKIDVWFDYGSHPDWIFNGWYKIYPDYEIFKQFAEAENAWLKN
jgi:hypothetical protein